MGTPVNGVPVQRVVLGSVHHHGVQRAPKVHQILGFGLHRLTCPRQRCFAAQPKGLVSDRFPTTTAWSSSHAVMSPVAFRPSALASWASCPAEEFRPSYDRPTRTSKSPGPQRGFHVPRTRDTTGQGALCTPRPAVFTRPTYGLGRRLPPLPTARPCHPGVQPVFLSSSSRGIIKGSFTFARPVFPSPGRSPGRNRGP